MNAIRTFLTNPVRRTVAMGILSGALIAVYGLYLSREHITHVGYAMGLKPLEAETLFIFIDIVAIYGKMLTSKHLTAKTRRTGYKFLAFGGAASLVCVRPGRPEACGQVRRRLHLRQAQPHPGPEGAGRRAGQPRPDGCRPGRPHRRRA